MKYIIILSAFGFISFFACKSKKTTVSSTTVVSAPPVAKPTPISQTCTETVTFASLKPLMDKSCTTSGCHDQSSYAMNFKEYAIFKKYAADGEVRKHVLQIRNMPPDEKLSDAELAQFRCWLDQGMKEK